MYYGYIWEALDLHATLIIDLQSALIDFEIYYFCAQHLSLKDLIYFFSFD